MAYRASPESYFFVPESGGPPLPLVTREPVQTIGQLQNSSIDPGLILLGVIGLVGITLGFLGFLAYLKEKR